MSTHTETLEPTPPAPEAEGEPEEVEADNPADRGEATKSAETILRQEITVGTEQLERPARNLFLSALSAGLDIGFGPMMVLVIIAMGLGDELGGRLAQSLVYAIGFVIVILGRSELFTEHTTLAILPLLSGGTTLKKVARLWGLVYAGNILGAVVFAAFGSSLGISLGLFTQADLQTLSHHLLKAGSWPLFGSAIAAGWMMGMVSWLVTASRDSVGQILIILLVAGSIQFLGLHHSIAGSVEILLGVFGADVGILAYLRFLALATLGNAVGGAVLVALLKYGHIQTRGSTVGPALGGDRDDVSWRG